MSEAISAQALEAVRGVPWLRLAVLFGSAARGTLRPDSDLDIGILTMHADVSLWDEADLESRLERASGRDVDLVRLDQASTLLKFEVARDGKVLCERLLGDYVRFRDEALGEYLDFIPTFRRAADRFCQVLIERAGVAPWIHADLITQKLGFLQEHLLRLQRRRPTTLEEFLRDNDRQDLTALSFVLAVQETIDIAMHIAAEESLGLPGSYTDAFALLARHDVIPADLAKRFEGVVRVRNRVVHGYATVDAARFWNDLPAGIAALTEFAAAIATFARKPRPPG